MDTAAASALSTSEAAEYEYRRVTTSERKMDETQRETVPSVVADVQSFLQSVATAYTPEDAAQYGDALYGAMNTAGAAMCGLGPADTYPFPALHSVTGAGSFYEYNVSQTWKEASAARIGVSWDSPLVFAAWKDAVTNGQDMDESMLEPDSVALEVFGWLTPDERMVVATASTREEGTKDFFVMCHVVSLAPEWYPDGLVCLNPSPLPACLRPVSFDGMTSPLWVQRPPDQHAATGGDALETLTQSAIPVSACVPLQSYIVTDEMTAALNGSPSVNLYSVDLALSASGGSEANQRLGKEQQAIVVQVRRARTQADRGFEKLDAGMSMQPEETAPQTAVPASATTNLGLRRTRSYRSLAELKEQMEAWAKAGAVENRGQRFPSERFEREAQEAPERAAQIAEAASELLRESSDPRVLRMVAQLARHAGFAPYYDALLQRMETGSVPDGPGIRSRTLREDLLKRLADPVPATNATLAARAHAVLKKEGRPDLRLEMLNQADPSGELLDALAEVCKGEADPWLLALTAARMAQRNPDRLPRAIAIVAGQKENARHRFREELLRVAPDWSAQHAAELSSLASKD